MGLAITAILTCDKDLTTTAVWADLNAPIPEGWEQVVGSMDNATVTGFYCPTCIAQYGTRELFKEACDSSPGLTDPEVP